MTKNLQQLQSVWHKRLIEELPQQSKNQRQSIIRWLFDRKTSLHLTQGLKVNELAKFNQVLEYRYGLLQKRYLTVNSSQGYRRLMSRLGAVAAQYCSQKRMKYCQQSQKELLELIQQVLQKLIKEDTWLKQAFVGINQGTCDRQLRDALILTTLEEYCLRPMENQPFFLYCLRHHLNHQRLVKATRLTRLHNQNQENRVSDVMEKIPVFR